MSRTNAAHWSDRVRDLEARGEPYILITVLGARGSTPRGSGTKMVVDAGEPWGTIGGGKLEFDALHLAREMLNEARPGQRVENYPLGEKLGQCCGGSTSLLFECFVPSPISVYLFGAGHVGRALAPLLATLPLRVHWVDPRAEQFPATLPAGVSQLCSESPCDVVRGATPGSYFVIMTHEHPLDYALMEAALARGDAAYIGVIGSASKWRRFRMRLEHRGHDADVIGRVHCPVGLAAVPGKRPEEIAVSVAAQLIAQYHARNDAGEMPAPRWKSLPDELTGSPSPEPKETTVATDKQ